MNFSFRNFLVGRLAVTICTLLALSACTGQAPHGAQTSQTSTGVTPGPSRFPGPALPEPGPSRAACQALRSGEGSPLRGAQSEQFRPVEVSNRKYELGLPGEPRAVWRDAPTGLLAPIVLNISGSSAIASNTCLLGGAINGDLDISKPRGDQYDAYHSGIEQGNRSPRGFAVADGVRVDRMFDGYRFVGQGTGRGGGAYLKRFYGSDLRDDCLERDEFSGDVYVYDSLFEGCYSGISEIGLRPVPGARTVLDGVLMWIKPTTDRRNSSSADWCEAPDGCQELEARGAGTFAIWKGEADGSDVVEVRNSWFRLDRRTVWGLDAMAWPCGPRSSWGTRTRCSYRNVKLLWTSADPYPGPPLPAGVELVTGGTALRLWDAAVADWKAHHGYGGR